ncbi:hypothetical protein D3C78_1895950 [compost metagenome]
MALDDLLLPVVELNGFEGGVHGKKQSQGGDDVSGFEGDVDHLSLNPLLPLNAF